MRSSLPRSMTSGRRLLEKALAVLQLFGVLTQRGVLNLRLDVCSWPFATFRYAAEFGRFSNRPVRVKHFQAIHRFSVNVAHGLVLLFGIGTKALVSGFFGQEVFMQSSTSFSLWRRLGGRDDDQRGARFRARYNRATTLYPVGPRT